MDDPRAVSLDDEFEQETGGTVGELAREALTVLATLVTIQSRIT